ncbi:type II secretion system F family protein [Vallitalea maricola]|uniref:Uncharacterized protein n=1 Tax=Vallitalea maricola TaxID=3074433 RepID=A0ACB5UM67_9FIRM|nr:hypothetical protein AN2V17_22450 [Vallitalea sp. AN17-2]
MVVGIISFIILIGLFAVFFLTKNMYKEEMDCIDKKEYKLKELIPTSLFILDKAIGKKMKAGKNVRDNIYLIYGKREYDFRLRMHQGEKISLAIMSLIGVLFITLIMSFQGNDSISLMNNTIKKPSLGKGNVSYDLQAQIEIDGEKDVKDITVLVPEENPDKEKARNILKETADELPNYILGDNLNLKVIDKKLNLVKWFPGKNIKIAWTIDCPYIEKNGELDYSNITVRGNETNITAKLTYAGESIDKIIDLKVYPKTLTKEEKLELIEKAIKEELSTDNLLNRSDDEVILPITIEGHMGKISWLLKSDGNDSLKFLIFGLIVIILLVLLKDYEVKKKVEDRNSEIRKCFPEFVIKLTLLLNAGMTLSRSWNKISKDYYDDITTSRAGKLFLYEEMLETLQEINNGLSEVKAYEDFGKRCKIPEMMRFTTVIVQNIRKGNDTLVMALQNQANEAWDVRKNIAKKAGEKASSKLLIPMGIMFIIIIIIVMMPAFMSLGV